jgi:hypothetical protein
MPLNERTINSARNPKWSDYFKTSIDLEVDFDELDEEYVPFNAHPDDIVSWGPELYNRAIAGEFGEIAEWEIPEDVTDPEIIAKELRSTRDVILTSEVDPIVSNPLRWASMTEDKQQEWADYRQALLDLPETQSSAYQSFSEEHGSLVWVNLTLPTKPE